VQVLERLQVLAQRPEQPLIATVDAAPAGQLARLDQLDLGVEEQGGGADVVLGAPALVEGA
jgi:hypothetical protein